MNLSMKILLSGGLMLGGTFWVYLGYLFCLLVGAKHHKGFESLLIWLAIVGSGVLLVGIVATTISDKKDLRRKSMEGSTGSDKLNDRESVAHEIYGSSYSSLCWRRRDRVDEVVRERHHRAEKK